MIADSPTQPLTAEEQEQIQQTIEMFEVITQANVRDTQSLEILKDAYAKLGRSAEATAVSRKLAEAFMELGQYSSALLEYENILQNNPDDTEVIVALGVVEQRLQEAQSTGGDGGAAVGIDLDFKEVVEKNNNLIATKYTQAKGRIALPSSADSAAVTARLAGADDGNDALAKFLTQHRLIPDAVVQQALIMVRKKNKERAGLQVASSLLDEIVTRGAVEVEQLLCGILDRSKFAYIPLAQYDIDRLIVRMLPESITLARLIVPFDIVSRTMMIAVANPFDAAGKDAVQQLLEYNIQWHLADPAALIKVLNDNYR